MSRPDTLRDHARRIWQAGVEAVRPGKLLAAVLGDPTSPVRAALASARRILVVGGGKAGAAMAAAVEKHLADHLHRVKGLVNIPGPPPGVGGDPPALRTIRLHVARPAGSNHPTEEGVRGVREMLELTRGAGPDDVLLCLLSGGGSALLPAPAEGVTLADKQQVTRLLHRCGATIHEMNAVRKHLSAVKGGSLAKQFRGKELFSLIISDVTGDPLDVIASGPTAPDPTTFADALAVLERYGLTAETPATVMHYLERGRRGEVSETAKSLPGNVHNLVLGNNQKALAAAQSEAERLGYPVLNLGSFIEGEAAQVGAVLAGLVRSVRADGQPVAAPACVLCGGETTVTLGKAHGVGGRNQELTLALAQRLGAAGLRDVAVLSGGTDGEDGPTDAAGAVADEQTLRQAAALGLDPADFLRRHDAYTFFDRAGGLLKTGLTQTNVMDVQVLLVGAS